MAANYSIQVYNITTGGLVTNTQCQTMVAAFNTILPAFCAAWNILVPTVTFVAGTPPSSPAKNVWVFVIQNLPPSGTAAGTLAYHTETSRDNITGNVFAGTIINTYHGGVLADTGVNRLSVANALSHELLESLVDGYISTFWVMPSGTSLVAGEVCDPTQSPSIPVTVSGQTVSISNFIFPAWTDSAASPWPRLAGPWQTGYTQFDYLKLINKPFTIYPGGYASILTLGRGATVTQVYAAVEESAYTRAKLNNPLSRAGKRALKVAAKYLSRDAAASLTSGDIEIVEVIGESDLQLVDAHVASMVASASTSTSASAVVDGGSSSGSSSTSQHSITSTTTTAAIDSMAAVRAQLAKMSKHA